LMSLGAISVETKCFCGRYTECNEVTRSDTGINGNDTGMYRN